MRVERIKAIYSEIEGYEVGLAADPRSLGPSYLQDIIARCRNYLNAIGRVQLEVHREKQDVSRSLRAMETAFEVAIADLLANNETVKRLPNIEDRKATANMILREERQVIADLRAQQQDLDYVDKAVRYRHKELTATMSEIKLQRALIRDEIDSGAMYGDERTGVPSKPTSPVGSDIDEDEISRMMGEEAEEEVAAVESHVETPTDPAPAPTEASDPEADVHAFLGAPTMVDVDSDFEDVFDNL